MGSGIDICLRPWYSLTHAFVLRLFYRVRLCLDGVPSHAWTPDIVERIIGNKCALQTIVTDLVQPQDTRHIELWAWSPDPSAIPKKIWLAFTHGTSEVFVTTEPPPEALHLGARFPVFIHMPLLEDYTAAKNDLQAALDNPDMIIPERRRYEWRYGVPDGAPPGTRPIFPTRLPKPPRMLAGGPEWRPRGGHDSRGQDDSRDRRGYDDGRETALSRWAAGQDSDANRDVDHDREAALRRSLLERRRGKAPTGRTTCNDQGFVWPGHGDDDTDDYDHPGHGRKYDDTFWGTDVPIRRDRTRSPPRRHYNTPTGRRHDAAILKAIFNNTLSMLPTTQVNKTAHPIDSMRLTDGSTADDEALLLANKAGCLTSRLTPTDPGEKVMPEPVKVQHVFARLKEDLHIPTTPPLAPSVAEVAAALDAMLLHDQGASTVPPAACKIGQAEPQAQRISSLEWAAEPLEATPTQAGPQAQLKECLLPVGLVLEPYGPTQSQAQNQAGQPATEDNHDCTGPQAVARNSPLNPSPADDEAPTDNYGSDDDIDSTTIDEETMGISSLFQTPPPPVLQQPAPRRARQRRNIDLTTVRRSARLAVKPTMPAEEKAHRNLCRKLGISTDELAPIEEVMRDFICTFTGPLPAHIMAGMTAIFDLENEVADMIDDALINHAGQGAPEINEVQDA